MITLHDKNLSWEAPDGFLFDRVEASGSYLKVFFHRYDFDGERPIGANFVVLYLNDQGREVARTVENKPVLDFTPVPVPPPPGRWFRFKNAWLIALQGFQEMIRCLRQS